MKNIVFDFHGVIYNPRKREVDSEVLKIIKNLYEKEYTLHIFTNSSKHSLENADKQKEFLKYFDTITHQPMKPQPESFEELFEKVEGEPSEMILIDDSSSVLREAREYNMITIEYSGSSELKNKLAEILNILLDS